MSGTHGKWVAEGEAASAKMQQNCITEEKNWSMTNFTILRK
jgi:hypothetical protein